ncbi:MAG TPA: hypothetical protein VII52_08545 [Gemmatimonadaceae bacterium]
MRHIRVLSTALVVTAFSGMTVLHAQGRGRGDDKRQPQAPKPVPAQEQQRRVQQEQQRSTQYRQQLPQQVQRVQQQTSQLQQQNRAAQYRTQQEYAARLQQQQQQQLQAQRDYSRDPYVTTPHNYRYRINGTYRQTNQYGVDVLKQAVNNGYIEGVRAGQADRQDRHRSNYADAPAYRDANYGYSGNYVDRSDYNYYFRQGFQKGYVDGYNSRNQYGSYSNGTGSILGNLLTSILGLQSIR